MDNTSNKTKAEVERENISLRNQRLALGGGILLTGFLFLNDTVGLKLKKLVKLDPSAEKTWVDSDTDA